MHGNMHDNLLVSFISYEARYKEYHHQKRVLENRNFCHIPAYLATLLHSNNTKDVKELMVHIRKKCSRGSCCVNFIIVLKENVQSINQFSGPAYPWGVAGAAAQVGASKHLDPLQQRIDALLGCQGETN